ncbi:MAG TPA: hypothetical protein VGU61_18495 [Noviherbaspirillum sp.]|jgi:hypothetical protein|uniref:hypothetical protein n=1 Tax=Noviherbaspirillum sp. TaxID=1926288 RepID=UPI002DDD496C|nr:hypothetical protein [Noviherbaspirillum sp.]HEV2612258.1 hypothetical protein [Noviherbaspirillum sp.]
MNIIKLAILLAICFFGYQQWERDHKDASAGMFGNDSERESGTGFVTLPPFDGAQGKQVVIFAPENCPEDGARRADDLASQLSRMGIPVVRSQHANFSLTDSSAANKVMAVMNGEIPIVFVKGRAKANPSVDEVIAEYSASAL